MYQNKANNHHVVTRVEIEDKGCKHRTVSDTMSCFHFVVTRVEIEDEGRMHRTVSDTMSCLYSVVPRVEIEDEGHMHRAASDTIFRFPSQGTSKLTCRDQVKRIVVPSCGVACGEKARQQDFPP